jgi:hypothetical protein
MNLSDLQNLFEKAEATKLVFNGHCHDCRKVVRVVVELERDGKVVVSGGALYNIGSTVLTPKAVQEYVLAKCDDCHTKDSELRMYKPVEVYSRIVGYMRPIASWNNAKQSEFAMRKEFKV